MKVTPLIALDSVATNKSVWQSGKTDNEDVVQLATHKIKDPANR